MAIEIEKKFLVDPNKLPDLKNGNAIKQAYISTLEGATVRARIKGQRGYLCLKGRTQGVSRSEFEYEIPLTDAEQIITELCSGKLIEKTRYLLRHGKHTWELDIFHGENEGLMVAEIELTAEDENFDLPPWVTTDVSRENKYYNANLLTKPYGQW